MEFVDTHCHIDFDRFDSDREAVLAQAAQAGVKRIINPGINVQNSRQVVQLAQRHPNIFAGVGIHPNDAGDVAEDALIQLAELAKDPKVVAVGEIGLDYYWDRAPKAEQRRVFEQQLSLAKTLDLPVIVHQREAGPDTMAILRQWAVDGTHPGGTLHAFSGDAAMVEEAASLGLHMSVGGPVTFKNAKGYPDVVRRIPLDRLLMETDAPFLSPHPYRGKRNEPARVALIAQTLADIFNVDIESLAKQTTANAETLFRLPEAFRVRE